MENWPRGNSHASMAIQQLEAVVEAGGDLEFYVNDLLNAYFNSDDDGTELL